MSYSFTIGSSVAATPRTLFQAAGIKDAVCREVVDLDAKWPEGVLHFYRPRVSCRVIEVSRSHCDFAVRIMSHSSPTDYQFGMGLVEATARHTCCTIRSDDGDVIDANEFRLQFDEAWIMSMTASAFDKFKMAMNQGGTSTIHGANRTFTIGPELLSEFGFDEDREQFSVRFFDRFHRLQWIDLNDCFKARVMAVSFEGLSEQQRISPVGVQGLKYLLQKVDFVTAQAKGDLVFVPWHQLPSVFMGKFQRLDENLATIDAISKDEWPAVADRMRSCSKQLG